MRIIDYPYRLSTRPPSPEQKRTLENVARQVRRIAVEREHERRNAEDLAFLEWVKEAPTPELAAQRPFAVSWQRVAIERELARRARHTSCNNAPP